MGQTLILRLRDETFDAIRRQAEAAGPSPAEVAASSLEQQFGRGPVARAPRPARSEAEQEAARRRSERHFGSVDLGRATGAENEAIDADLAGEYADPHEGP
ncbi:MAG: hypothetical protein AB1505_29875 [Candidatus Latescibacterota bacterium]